MTWAASIWALTEATLMNNFSFIALNHKTEVSYCTTFPLKIIYRPALKLRAFDKLLFREDPVVNKLLMYLNDGTRSIYILDILALLDISIWKNRQLKYTNEYLLRYRDLLDMLSSFSDQSYEANKLLLSYNPLMTIVLSCELAKTIAVVRRKFENECRRVER